MPVDVGVLLACLTNFHNTCITGQSGYNLGFRCVRYTTYYQRHGGPRIARRAHRDQRRDSGGIFDPELQPQSLEQVRFSHIIYMSSW